MATIDLTLKDLKFANVADFTRPFGTKKEASQNAGSLITSEILENFALPYDTQRPVIITEDSITTEIQHNCVLVLTGGTSLELGNAQFVGCTATIFNATANTITITDGEFSFTVLANDKREVQWNGTKWESKSNLVTANIDNATIKTLTVQTKATVPTPTATTDASNKGYVDDRTLVYITESFSSSNSWYRKWSNGFIEQGGKYYYDASGTVTVSLPKNFTNIDTVSVLITLNVNTLSSSATAQQFLVTRNITLQNFQIHMSSGDTAGPWKSWYANGF